MTKLIITIAISAIIISGGTYYLSRKYVDSKVSDLNARIDQDSKSITDLKKAFSKLQASSTSSSASSNSSENQLLIAACQAINPGLSCAVDTVEGNYATGTASGDAEGGHWYAKKQNSTWSIVLNGLQDVPACSAVSGFPRSIVPECS